MPVRVPVPRRYWPRTAEDLMTLSKRMGGPFTLVFGPEEPASDGRSRRRIVGINVTLDAPAEGQVSQTKPEPGALDARTQGFIKELARRTAKAWVAELRRTKAAKYEENSEPYEGSSK